MLYGFEKFLNEFATAMEDAERKLLPQLATFGVRGGRVGYARRKILTPQPSPGLDKQYPKLANSISE